MSRETNLLKPSDQGLSFSRRGFIKAAACGGLIGAASPVLANFPEHRLVSFVHTHTGEELTAVYFRDGRYENSALARVAYLLRDFRSGDVHGIDPLLLDILFELQVRNGHDQPFEIISGYRNPLTNANLRLNSSVAAEHSMHIKGRAIDIRVTGVATKKLRDVALAMRRGGVGYYGNANSLHLDTGRVRSW